MPTTKPKMKPTDPWCGFVVLNSVNVVLGVYGSALEDMAQQQRDRIQSNYPFTQITVKKLFRPTRPRVGDTLFT